MSRTTSTLEKFGSKTGDDVRYRKKGESFTDDGWKGREYALKIDADTHVTADSGDNTLHQMRITRDVNYKSSGQLREEELAKTRPKQPSYADAALFEKKKKAPINRATSSLT